MNALRTLTINLACWALAACGLFPESSFVLSPESRLPKWFDLDSVLPRSQVTVEMSYYISPLYGRTAAFVLRRQDDTEIARLSGRERGDHPVYLGPSTTDPLH